MPEIEAELTVDLCATCVKSILNSHNDKMIISGLDLDEGQSATLGWLGAKPKGTILTLQLKVKAEGE